MNLSNLRLPELVRQNLTSRGWKALLPAQREMLPLLLDDVPFIVCAHGGSGKRTALCAGLAARLNAREDGRLERGRRPRAVVITGTPALGNGICACFDALVLGSMLVSLNLGAGRQHDRQRRIGLGVDLVVGSAEALLQQEAATPGWLDDVEVLSIADARSLLDAKDGPGRLNAMRNLLSFLERRGGRGAPVVSLLSDHWSEAVEALAGELSPGARRLRIGGRFAAPAVLERFLLVGRISKMRRLIEEVRSGGRDRRTLICCDRRRVGGVCAAFEKEGFPAVALETPQDGRIEGFSLEPGELAVASFTAAAALPAGSLDLVCIFRPPESPEAYEAIARLVDFSATVERPWCGQVFMLVSSDQIEDFRALSVQLANDEWKLEPLSIRLLNPLPEELVDSGEGIARRRALCIERVHADLCEAGHLGEPQVSAAGKETVSEEPGIERPEAKARESVEAVSCPMAVDAAPGTDDGATAVLPKVEAAAEKAEGVGSVAPLSAEVPADEAVRAEPADEVAESEAGSADAEAHEDVPLDLRTEEPEASVTGREPFGAAAGVPADEAVATELPAEADRLSEEAETTSIAAEESEAVLPDEESIPEEAPEAAGDGNEAESGEEETAPAHRRTLTIRADYVPRREQAPTVTITEPLSSNTVELRAAQERMRRAMRGGEKLTHQMVGRRGTVRRPKRNAALPAGEVEGILAAQPGARLPGEKRSRKGQKNQNGKKSVGQGQEKTEKRRNARRQSSQPGLPPEFDYAASEALTVSGLTAAALPPARLSGEADERPAGGRRRGQKNAGRQETAPEARKQDRPTKKNGRHPDRRKAPKTASGEEVRQPDAAAAPTGASEATPVSVASTETARQTPAAGEAPAASVGAERNRRNGKPRKLDRNEPGKRNAEAKDRVRGRKKPKARPSPLGAAVPGESGGWNDDADDNFGNSINFNPARKARADVMPWQTAEAYGFERPQGLSFAQTTPMEREQREGLSTSYLGLADHHRSRPQGQDGRPGDGRKRVGNRFRKPGSRNPQNGQKGRKNRRGKGGASGQGGVPDSSAD